MINEQLHSGELRGVIIPSIGVNLLLPNAAIAEVTSLQEPLGAAARAPWLLGDIDWRGQKLPVVALGTGDDPVRSMLAFSRLKLVVCYVPNGNERLPYLGLCSTGMPHLVTCRPADLLPPVIDLDVPFALHQLIHEDTPTCIPNLDAIAEAILGLPTS